MTVNYYDFIIIGTGAGGGTLAYKLASSGKKILVLEQLLLLKSANDHHPNGLANSSNLVGRNYMAHNFAVVMTLNTKRNHTVFP
ncbi:MAG: NAD(P)-binding protein, partial [Dolichospermum sp.]